MVTVFMKLATEFIWSVLKTTAFSTGPVCCLSRSCSHKLSTKFQDLAFSMIQWGKGWGLIQCRKMKVLWFMQSFPNLLLEELLMCQLSVAGRLCPISSMCFQWIERFTFEGECISSGNCAEALVKTLMERVSICFIFPV